MDASYGVGPLGLPQLRIPVTYPGPMTLYTSGTDHPPITGKPGRVSPPRLGLIVNPIAGMGGSVGLHGTDGEAYLRAERLGAVPVAANRAGRSLRRVAESAPGIGILTGSGPMGEEVARRAGFHTEVVAAASRPTSAEDTRELTAILRAEGVALLLFAGGDGTARDIVRVLGTDVPVVGIPTGVKMHSAVFGHTPEAAGAMAARFLRSPDQVPLVTREVLDAAAGTPGRVSGFAVASVPLARDLLQSGKATVPLGDDSSIDRLCASIALDMVDEHVYILGPGTTVARITDHLGLEGTVAGVDVVINRRIVQANATRAQLLALTGQGRPATILLGVIGGQGFLLGRGNQQLDPEVIRRVGEHNVMILAGETKIRRLDPPVLRVDTGNETSEPVMLGYRRVHTAPGRSTVMKVIT